MEAKETVASLIAKLQQLPPDAELWRDESLYACHTWVEVAMQDVHWVEYAGELPHWEMHPDTDKGSRKKTVAIVRMR
jgi:hypothetical protein